MDQRQSAAVFAAEFFSAITEAGGVLLRHHGGKYVFPIKQKPQRRFRLANLKRKAEDKTSFPSPQLFRAPRRYGRRQGGFQLADKSSGPGHGGPAAKEMLCSQRGSVGTAIFMGH